MQIEYIEYVFLYKLYLNAYICIFVSASICIQAFFLGYVEQKRIYRTSWKAEGRRTVIQPPDRPGSQPAARSPLPAPSSKDATIAASQRSIFGGASPPAPTNPGAGGGMLGAGMRGCQATAASPCPPSTLPPPTSLLLVIPPRPGCAPARR